MKPLQLEKRGIATSRIVMGCMGLGGGWNQNAITADDIKQAHQAVDAALSIGINFFDHADIYTFGKAETVFGQVLKERKDLRENIFIQSKCGIRFEDGPGRPGRYDFSSDYIRSSVDGILERLGVEFIDFLLLHRPDPLMEPEEVAEVIYELKESGKVRHFGVSNMSAAQIKLLQSSSNEPFIINQMEMSLAKLDWLETGVLVNHPERMNSNFPEETLEYCRLENIQIQAWGSLAQGLFSGRHVDGQTDSIKETAQLVKDLADKKQTSPEAILLAWLMRHPAGIQPILGTTRPERIQKCGEAMKITLTREEWYSLFVSSRGRRLP
ncbi:aldo/keto reductase family oxidoreductase [Paenibacillus sp. NPDC058071]|uniref:aldo/keto reductase n=1 Tax=Paenibacillus sp. NPDC058071 TaxID=3346326 RepID=UPI0036DDA249